ncbi:MAG TPA: SpoIIE family protein phosphatase [Candidatus Sulfotelmatobacter sp.]|nr:SpoIIE family protein phosphatase [Candidatus Sulfotelmatobacter sp.]
MPNVNIKTPDWLRQMESILEELNEGVAILDDQPRIIFANEALTKLWQYDLAELRGRALDAIFPPEDIPHIIREHELGHRYGRHRSEFHLPRKDGKKIPVIVSGRVIQGPDGQDYVVVTVTDISELKRVEEQLRTRQKEIDADLSTAARIQQSLAPNNLVWKDLAVEAYYSPAHTIGGDFGIVLPQGDEFLNLILCDVSGHGIASALMANRIYSETLHALERKTEPGRLLKCLHDFVHDRIPQEGFYFTMAAVRFSQCGRCMTFAAAAQPPAILVSKGTLRLLDSQNGILGYLSQFAPSESVAEIELVTGDRLVLYTDGLVEVFNRSEEMLGVEGLEELVRQSATRALPEMKQAILEGAAAWSRGALADDMSLVIVEVR